MMYVSLAALLLIGLTACGQVSATSPPTPTTLRVTAASASDAEQRTLRPVGTDAPVEATEDAAGAPCETPDGLARTAHDVVVAVEYSSRSAAVDQTVHLVNRTSQPLETLALLADANRYPGAFTLEAVRVNANQPAGYELAGRALTLTLEQPLQPGCSAEIELSYRLKAPQYGVDVSGGSFGYSARQTNFADALVVLATRRDGAWVTPDISPIGEQMVADPADWSVNVTIDGAPDDLTAVFPGVADAGADGSWTVRLPQSRDFSFSLGQGLIHQQAGTRDGVSIDLYTFPATGDDRGAPSGPDDALSAAVRAAESYTDLFGELPLNRLVIVQGDFPDGMEHSGIMFVGGEWFRTYAGSPNAYLTLITVHEMAHQWWYGLVGNNQAEAPFMDEALATYSELIFIEEYYPELRQWWWDTRVGVFVQPDDELPPVDSPVFRFDAARPYINAVYLNGARMLQAIRDTIGTEAFFDWLGRYSRAAAGRVADPALLWSVLTPQERDAIRPVVAQFGVELAYD